MLSASGLTRGESSFWSLLKSKNSGYNIEWYLVYYKRVVDQSQINYFLYLLSSVVTFYIYILEAHTHTPSRQIELFKTSLICTNISLHNFIFGPEYNLNIS